MPKQDRTYREFKKYYAQYAEKIYAYLFFRSGRNRDLAEDLTSEVFLKALERFSTFNPKQSPFGAWIYTIARNHLIDHYRVSRVSIPIDDVSETELVKAEDLGAEIDQKDKHARVVAAINTLPDSYREILTLKYLNGLDNNEIGAVLGKTQSNIRVLIHRSLTSLKQKLAS